MELISTSTAAFLALAALAGSIALFGSRLLAIVRNTKLIFEEVGIKKKPR
jgi:hypothetical protein